MDSSPTFLKWPDYLVLVSFLAISLGIGVYHALTGGRQKTTTEFIMANRSLGVLPTAISMLVSFKSALMLLGNAAEMYLYGSQHLVMFSITVVVSCLIAERICVPWIFPLQLVSVYEYFEMRFQSKAVRILAAAIGVFTGIIYMGSAMYAPSAALYSVTGLPLSVSIPAMAIVSVTYTALGGMRAVIWTDVFQCGIMIVGMVAVLIKGLVIIGGFDKVIALNEKEGRLIWAIWNPDPRERHTVWGYMISFVMTWIFIYGLNQAATQRYSATTSLSKARITILLNIPAQILLSQISCFTGLVVVAYYSLSACDPITNKEIKNANHLLPYFVTKVFASAPGFAGVFLATLYGGALSSVSSSLSGSAANFWEDILKWKLSHLPESRKALINRFLVILFGIIATGISFLAATIPGPMTQVTISLQTTISGPLFGMFLLGGVSRIPNWKGSLIGAGVGLAINLWLNIGSFSLNRKYPRLPALSTEGCSSSVGQNPFYNYSTFTEQSDAHGELWNTTTAAALNIVSQSGGNADLSFLENIYSISYMWLTMIGTFVTLIVGFISSLPFRDKDMENEIEGRMLIPWRQALTWGGGEKPALKKVSSLLQQEEYLPEDFTDKLPSANSHVTPRHSITSSRDGNGSLGAGRTQDENKNLNWFKEKISSL